MPIPFDKFRLLNGTRRKVENVTYRRQAPEQPAPIEVSYDGTTVVDVLAPGDFRELDPAPEEVFLRCADGSPVEIVLDTGQDPPPP